jgi:hypothetical protein
VQVPWPDPRCIVCLGTPIDGESMTERSNAHVLPQSIGGELSALCLCKRCDNEMGRSEALLAKDISVRRRVKYQLQSRLPEKLASSILTGEQYFADHENYGRVYAVVDEGGELQPKQSPTLKDDQNSLAQALAELSRLGASEERKTEIREQFERAEPGAWIDVRHGLPDPATDRLDSGRLSREPERPGRRPRGSARDRLPLPRALPPRTRLHQRPRSDPRGPQAGH